MRGEKLLFTIGHSTRSTREFVKILKAFDIEVLVDVRHYPGSRHNPQFGKSRLKQTLARHGIQYVHLEDLGGRRRPDKESDQNAGWRSPQFKGYADYMQTVDFSTALKELIGIARKSVTVIMCSEAVPWRCHRSMIADAMIANKFTVLDIFSETNARKHSMISFARVKGKTIIYPKEA